LTQSLQHVFNLDMNINALTSAVILSLPCGVALQLIRLGRPPNDTFTLHPQIGFVSCLSWISVSPEAGRV
jgi:hypothetical protein